MGNSEKMVVYEIKEKYNDHLLYVYFPEGNMNNRPGIIEYDLVNHNSFIRELAEDDRIREVLAEDLNKMADAINEMVEECGGTDYCKYVSEPSQYAVYGSHAMKRIAEDIKAGSIKEKGTVMWY